MAEVVQRKLEAMLPELEELQRAGLFTRGEVQVVVRKRRTFEYRMLRRPADKEDFLQAIQYELNLDMLRAHRKKKHGVVVRQAEADYAFTSRVHVLFQRVLRKFKGDLALWLQYVEFCQRVKHDFALGRVLAQALAVHPSASGLWVLAARTQMEQNRDIAAARSLLQRGIRRNPQSHHLWHEAFRLELLHVDKVQRRQKVLGLEGEESAQVSDAFLLHQTAAAVYREAVATIPGEVQFRLKFLPVLDEFDEVEHLKEELYQRDFPNNPEGREAVARRPLRGLDLSTLDSAVAVDLCDRVEAGYREALTAMTENRGHMWALYIKWLIEKLPWQPFTDVMQVCLEASRDKQATEDLLALCITTCLRGGLEQPKLEDLCCLATRAFPHSGPLWLLQLKCCACRVGVEPERAVALFQQAVQLVPVSSLLSAAIVGKAITTSVTVQSCAELWEAWFQFCVASSLPVKQVVELARQCGHQPVRVRVSVMYLEWSLLSKGLAATRRMYQRWLAGPHVDLAVILCCTRMEQGEDPPDAKQIRHLYEVAVREHGRSNPGLWLGYIRSELSLGPDSAASVTKLHWRAKRELDRELVEEFVAQYSLLLQTASEHTHIGTNKE